MRPSPALNLALLLELPAVVEVARLAGSGEAHLVGGAVRDALLGRPVGDLDLVVSGGGERLAEKLAAGLQGRLVRLGGERFAAFRVVVSSGLSLDLWDREEMSLEADLARRDLTINALAVEVPGGSLVDPFGGLADLGSRRLVATTLRSFADDPLRVLRLARFAAELPGFRAVSPTLALARASAERLTEVAAERIRYELERIFAAPGGGLGAARGLAVLAHARVYPGLWLGRPGEAGDHHGAPSRLARLARAERALARRLPALPASYAPARWASTFHALADEGAGALAGMVDRGYLLPRTGRFVQRLLEEPELPPTALEARRFLDRWREQWPVAAACLRAREEGSSGEGEHRARCEALAAAFERDGAELLEPARLLSGDEVQALLGIAAGPAVGQALERVRRAQVDGLVRTKEEAVDLLRSGTPM